jgi:stalled ribosome rescue protein Dom34
MPVQHVVVWIDHKEARVFHVEPKSFDEATLVAPHRHVHRHPKGPTEERHHPDDQHHFFRDVAKSLEEAEQILILGPSTAKLQLLTYLHANDKALVTKIVGVETVDHPTDKQIVAYARKYFDAEGAAR